MVRRAERWRVLMERLISRINNTQFFFLSFMGMLNEKTTYFFVVVVVDYLQGIVV
jgi:hypothetical protein